MRQENCEATGNPNAERRPVNSNSFLDIACLAKSDLSSDLGNESLFFYCFSLSASAFMDTSASAYPITRSRKLGASLS